MIKSIERSINLNAEYSDGGIVLFTSTICIVISNSSDALTEFKPQASDFFQLGLCVLIPLDKIRYESITDPSKIEAEPNFEFAMCLVRNLPSPMH